VNFSLYCHLKPETAESTLQLQIDELRVFEGSIEWKTHRHDRPTDLGDRLKKRGFVPDTPPLVLCLDLDVLPPSLASPPSADIRRLVDPAELNKVVAVEEQVWASDFNWLPERFSLGLRRPGYLEIYLAYVDGMPASVGWTHVQEGSEFASLWRGSTLPALRGIGLCTAILAERVQAARVHGRRYTPVDAEPASHRILVRHGFEELTTTTTFTWEPEAS
jgi:hypothetical protein